MLAKEAAFTELMDATESYLKHREQLSTATKQGVFSIAQAKYSVSGPLGKTQYDMEMEATTKVNILCGQPSWSDSEDDAGEEGPVPVPLFKLLSLTHFKSDDSSGSQAGPDSSVESDSASTLQQGTDRPGTHSICTSKAAPHTVNPGNVQARQGASELQAGIRQKRGVTTSDHLHQSVNGDNKQKDPLRWFGVLVPPSLRTAQAQFTSAVEHAVDLANARQRVLNAVKTWEILQA